MPLYRLTPLYPDDPRWASSRTTCSIVVRARNVAWAGRLAARELWIRRAPRSPHEAGTYQSPWVDDAVWIESCAGESRWELEGPEELLHVEDSNVSRGLSEGRRRLAETRKHRSAGAEDDQP